MNPDVLQRIVLSYSNDLPKLTRFLESEHNLLCTKTERLESLHDVEITDYTPDAPAEMKVLHMLLKQMQAFVEETCQTAPKAQPDMFGMPGFWPDSKKSDQLL